MRKHEERLFEYLSSNPKIHLINKEPSPTMSFYIEGLDSHLAGGALSIAGIMARTGYFCVHYYLDHKMHYPPLIKPSTAHAPLVKKRGIFYAKIVKNQKLNV